MKITGTKTIARMLKRFYQWLSNRRHFLFSWYTKDSQETQEPERSLVELPSDLRNQLVEAVENLPNNPADQNIILSKLDELFESWRNDPKNSSNSIVILSSPITAVSKILADTLEEWTKQKDVSLKLLPLDARPLAINSIKSKLEYHLAQESRENQVGSQLEIVLIPNLSWCFLRSLEGLERIEY